MTLVRENLNEAKLNLPQEYIDKVRKEAGEKGWLGGPRRADFQQMNNLLSQIFPAQRDHEEELTELGKRVIQKFYGPVINGVELDIKIVQPDDEEKLEMTQKMFQKEDKEDQKDQEEQKETEEKSPEVELELKGIDKDIDKRKLINNVMQGEAQNVHSMMYDVKDEVTEITGNSRLLDLYMQFLELNKKFDWDESINLEQMMKQAPEMANAMETEWEEGSEEEGGDKPKIKARVLDLPMLIHETVKGIYELIAAGAIDPDPVRAQKILDATDTLADEQEDIRFGPFIAKDIRDYVNKVAEEISGTNNIPNLREFVFGKMIKMPANSFVDLITDILMKKDRAKSTIINFIKEIQTEFDEYNQAQIQHKFDTSNEDNYEDDEDEDVMSTKNVEFVDDIEEKPVQQPIKKPNYKNMGQAELEFQLNKAIDSEDWELAKEIQQYIKEPGK